MKQFYTLLVLAFTVITANAQIVNIPDANFKAILLNASPSNIIAQDLSGNFTKIDTNDNGEIEVSETSVITSLSVVNNISSLEGIESFVNLRTLQCQGNQIITLNISSNTNLQILSCFNNNMTTLIVNNAIEQIQCFYNQLTTLDLSNKPFLKKLECQNNLLTSLNLLNDNGLEELNISNNQLQNIDLLSTAPSLKKLLMGSNPFSSVVDINSLLNLEILDLKSLNINHFPLNSTNYPLLTNLKELYIENTLIGEFNYGLNPTVKKLWLHNTNLTIIDLSNLTLLEFLNISNNHITTLDLSPLNNLTTLISRNNPLDSIIYGNHPYMNNFVVSASHLTSFDLSSYSLLHILDVSINHQLTYLNVKNGSNTGYLYLTECPNLQFICVDENELNLYEWVINNNGYTNCSVSTYCSFVPGGTFYSFEGTTRFDNNSNGCDINDNNVPNQKFRITNSSTNGIFVTDQTGDFEIFLSAGNYTVTPILENPDYFTVFPTSTTITLSQATNQLAQDFCITANGVTSESEILLFSLLPPRPGFDSHYKITYKNKGNQVSNGSLSFSFDNSKMDLVSAMPVNTSSAMNSLTWNYSNLIPFETREIDLVFNINSPMETPAVNSGDLISFNASIVDTSNETPNNNSFTLNQTVVNSYDPNDKTCLEGNTITPSMVGNYVHYVIRFENTGTFAAQNVVVTDMIDLTKFDIASLIPQSSSHSFITRINNTTGKVEFIFENINLPFDDANNDGYVAFKIKTKSTLVLGNTFSNMANIYFDFNFPIVTDPAVTTVSLLNTQDFDFGTYFTLYPTPAKEVLNINMKATIGIQSVAVYNLLGQMVLAFTNAENSSSLDVSQLKTGTYIIKIVTDKGTASQKFSKE